MNKKIRLKQVSKTPRHNYFCFEKKQIFVEMFRKLLDKLGAEDYEVNEFGLKDTGTQEEDNIEKWTDKHWSYVNDHIAIDIVFGKKDIFLIITSERDLQDDISETINKYSKIIK